MTILLQKATLHSLLDPTAVLLKKLRIKAPGTYFHSLIVGELSASAAFHFQKADPLLALVGGYYHDIGKMVHAQAFAENQEDGDYPFQPEVIANHVQKSIELGSAFALPEEIIRMMATHHGSLPKPHREDQPKTSYEGSSLPHTIEESLIMLADSTEAATRALFFESGGTKESLYDIVSSVFSDKVEKAQLNESILIPSDLPQIEEAFVEVLAGMYHRRAALEKK